MAVKAAHSFRRLLWVILADQVHQHGLCLMGKPDKGRMDGEPARTAGRRAAFSPPLAGSSLVSLRGRPCAFRIGCLAGGRLPYCPLRWRRIAGHCRGHALIILRMIIIINNENKKLRVLRAAHQAGRKEKARLAACFAGYYRWRLLLIGQRVSDYIVAQLESRRNRGRRRRSGRTAYR